MLGLCRFSRIDPLLVFCFLVKMEDLDLPEIKRRKVQEKKAEDKKEFKDLFESDSDSDDGDGLKIKGERSRRPHPAAAWPLGGRVWSRTRPFPSAGATMCEAATLRVTLLRLGFCSPLGGGDASQVVFQKPGGDICRQCIGFLVLFPCRLQWSSLTYLARCLHLAGASCRGGCSAGPSARLDRHKNRKS